MSLGWISFPTRRDKPAVIYRRRKEVILEAFELHQRVLVDASLHLDAMELKRLRGCSRLALEMASVADSPPSRQPGELVSHSGVRPFTDGRMWHPVEATEYALQKKAAPFCSAAIDQFWAARGRVAPQRQVLPRDEAEIVYTALGAPLRALIPVLGTTKSVILAMLAPGWGELLTFGECWREFLPVHFDAFGDGGLGWEHPGFTELRTRERRAGPYALMKLPKRLPQTYDDYLDLTALAEDPTLTPQQRFHAANALAQARRGLQLYFGLADGCTATELQTAFHQLAGQPLFTPWEPSGQVVSLGVLDVDATVDRHALTMEVTSIPPSMTSRSQMHQSLARHADDLGAVADSELYWTRRSSESTGVHGKA